MDTAVALVLALNDQLHAAAERLLDGVNDAGAQCRAPLLEDRPLAAVALHAYYSLLGFAAVAAGREWPGARAAPAVGGEWSWPAVPAPPASVAELRAAVGAMHDQIAELVRSLPADGLAREVTLPWGQRTRAFDALSGGFGHAFEHMGHIGAIRAFGGFPTPPEDY